ncbi:DnaD domain protein [Weissella cibaria]|uniref:DnaD domain protein n=1 Tax=Weissella cibaria TaxID=137591 RepID=UPI00136DF6AD|nr:DnaD domain protein [Weissella cibaria]MBZ5940815.1 DnaD domain protein [Weissella cibaria]MYV35649.1 DnaD domain protein [Weissella cibaria]
MAQRRMFSKKVTDTDMFLDMPLSTQALYFHLNMHADDDGFVGNINTINRMIGASKDDEKLLLAKQFLIPFEDSGVVVIKDWRIHNYIRKDTYNSTMYSEERRKLGVSESGSYYVDEPLTERPRIVDDTATQVRLDKVSKGKSKVSEGKGIENTTDQPTGSLRNQLTDLVAVHGFADRLTPMQLNQLLEYVTEDGMEIGVLNLALQDASNRAIRNFKYVDAILRAKLNEGVKSVADWHAGKETHKQAVADEKVPDWMQELNDKLEGS